jgi:hypothetical protein
MLDKKKLVEGIIEQLQKELDVHTKAAHAALEAATHSENVAEDHHDTRGLEASYLAGAQANRAAELQRLIQVYKFMLLPSYESDHLIGPGALIELDLNNRRSFYFLVPQGGGIAVVVDGQPIRVITPLAPLGDALLGRSVGETFEVESNGVSRTYRIVGVS